VAATINEAVAAAPAAIASYGVWRAFHGGEAIEMPFETELDEVQRSWRAAPDFLVDAFFASDAVPLTREEIDHALLLLAWTRQDLLAALDGTFPEELSWPVEDAWSIETILAHTAATDWWYLDRLDRAPKQSEIKGDSLARLDQTRSALRLLLPSLAGDVRIVSKDLELWSPRKIVRRALWHEIDHTQHIHKFRVYLGSA
jgi:hypothetical protein